MPFNISKVGNAIEVTDNFGTKTSYSSLMVYFSLQTGGLRVVANGNYIGTFDLTNLTVSGLVPVSLAAAYATCVSFISANSGTGGSAEVPLGIIYSKSSFTSTDLTNDFTNSGATVSVVSNKIQMSGGAGFGSNLHLNGYSCLDRWKMYAEFSITVSGYGFGVGKLSGNTTLNIGCCARLLAGGDATNGQLIFYAGSNSANDLQVTSPTLAFSLNDLLAVTLERIDYTVYCKYTNLTTGTSTVTFAFPYTTYPNLDPYLDNTGWFNLYTFGGTMTVSKLVVSSTVVKNAYLAVVGDSKVQGYNSTSPSNRYASILNQTYRTSIILGGGGDKTVEVQNRIPEIVSLAPRNILLSIGSNDVRAASESQSAYFARYDSIVSSLASSLPSAKIFHTVPYESSVSLAALWSHVQATFPAANVIDTYTLMQTTGYLSSDNIHPNDAGHAAIAAGIVSSNKIS